MAEIPVQPRRGIRPWVWVVALIILAVILWAIFGRHRVTVPAATGRAIPAHVAPRLAARAMTLTTAGQQHVANT